MYKLSSIQKEQFDQVKDFFALSFDSLQELIWLKDPEGAYLFCNKQFKAFFDINDQDVAGKNDGHFFETALADYMHDKEQEVINAKQQMVQELLLNSPKDNRSRLFETTRTPVYDNADNLLFVLSVARDVTDLKAREEALINAAIKSDQRLHMALQATKVGIWEWDLANNEWYATPSYYTMLGYTPPLDGRANLDEEIAKIHPDDLDVAQRNIDAVLSGERKDYEYLSRVKHKNGHYIWITVRCMVIETDKNDNPLRILGVKFSIDELKKAQSKAEWLSKHDYLTGLPNRFILDKQYEKMLESSKQNQTHLALLHIDLDRFKNINDTIGYQAGDHLLLEVTKRLQTLVSDTFVVTRQSSDEFIALLEEKDQDAISKQVVAVKKLISDNYMIDDHNLVITTSIGACIASKSGEDLDSLSKSAHIALDHAKQSGRNQYAFFSKAMQQKRLHIVSIENAMHTAIKDNEFRLHYQPQISLSDGSLIGAEALIRWESSSLGMMTPDEFIPIAEDNGYIRVIGEWVIKESVAQMKQWQKKGIKINKLAINLSTVQFCQADLVEVVNEIFVASGLSAQFFELELTERITMNDPETATGIMDRLKALGLSISIDDFGTGYSSLSYLQRFPVDKLKIDQSFVQNMTQNSNDYAIVEAITALAQSLGLTTIAEGVETAEQLALVKSLGCDEAQGYYFSKPLPSNQMEQFISEYKNHLTP